MSVEIVDILKKKNVEKPHFLLKRNNHTDGILKIYCDLLYL